MFRSARHPVVFPQAEHARLSAVIALHWGNELTPRPAVAWEPFVAGVALHDRGYGQLDDDAIGEVGAERWLGIQEDGFAPHGEHPVTELIVAMHVQRLVAWGNDPARRATAERMAAALPALCVAAGVDAETAAAADAVTELCDLVSFDFCEELATTGSAAGIGYRVFGDGLVTLDPWPLGVPELHDVVAGFRSDGYPGTLTPVIAEFHLAPG